MRLVAGGLTLLFAAITLASWETARQARETELTTPDGLTAIFSWGSALASGVVGSCAGLCFVGCALWTWSAHVALRQARRGLSDSAKPLTPMERMMED